MSNVGEARSSISYTTTFVMFPVATTSSCRGDRVSR